VFRQQGGRCALWWHETPCRGPLDGHEVVRRGHYPDGPYDDQVVVVVCRGHHEIDDRRVESVRVGLRVEAGIWTRWGYLAVAEQRRRRRSYARGVDPGPPVWDTWPTDPLDPDLARMWLP